MQVGPTSFKHKIAQNVHNTPTMPAAFAVLPMWSETVKIVHGFTNMLLTNGQQHWANGPHVEFFLGDHTAVLPSTSCQLQDPHLVIAHSFQTLLSTFTSHPASKQCIRNSSEPAVKAGTKGDQVTIHKLLQNPHSWWPAFLQEAKMPRDVLDFINSATWH